LYFAAPRRTTAAIVPLYLRLGLLAFGDLKMKISRTDYVRSRRTSSYSGIAIGIREGGITCYLIDGKVYIDDDETDEYFRKKKQAKVIALYGADLFAAQ
jgi:hypothetical protein